MIDSGATVVIRPDSGHPPDVVLQVANILARRFGTTTNGKGYRVLDHVRIIQGDGINLDMLRLCLSNLYHHGFAADNIAFGMGGGLLQQVHRDTLQFAMKCSAIAVGGAWRDVYKQPVGDSGKASKRGKLALVRDASGVLHTTATSGTDADQLQVVFEQGEIVGQESFDAVRARAEAGLGAFAAVGAL